MKTNTSVPTAPNVESIPLVEQEPLPNPAPDVTVPGVNGKLSESATGEQPVDTKPRVQKPSVGRIVIVAEWIHGAKIECAAVVTGVNEASSHSNTPETLELFVMPPRQNGRPVTKVRYVEDAVAGAPAWSWPKKI